MTVYNRSLEKTKPLQELGILFASLLSLLLVLLLSSLSLSLSFLIYILLGAKVVSSPLEVAQNSNIVFTILGYPHDVREVVLGNKGVLQVLSLFLSFFLLLVLVWFPFLLIFFFIFLFVINFRHKGLKPGSIFVDMTTSEPNLVFPSLPFSFFSFPPPLFLLLPS